MRKLNAILIGSLLLIPLLADASEKLRLGDIPDENSKRDAARNKPAKAADAPSTSPEDRALVVGQLADESYREGTRAMQQGRLEAARAYFERVLVLTPNNARARQHLGAINRVLAERKAAAAPAKTMKAAPAQPVEKKSKPAREPAKTAASVAEDKEKSEALYLQALAASQGGKYETAYKRCEEALKFDPENLQARRMFERLDPRFRHR